MSHLSAIRYIEESLGFFTLLFPPDVENNHLRNPKLYQKKGFRLYVLELLASGWHESKILEEYPGLERENILACIRYAQEIIRSERVYSTTLQEKIAG